MFDISINKLLFFDLETAGVEKDYTTLLEKNPELARLPREITSQEDAAVPGPKI